MVNEFEILNKRMEDDATERHTYLMFVYTTTIATLAALFASQILEKFPLLCMMPLMIIVPFQARISYSRLTHAKIEAYVYVFYLPRLFPHLPTLFNVLASIIIANSARGKSGGGCARKPAFCCAAVAFTGRIC